MKTDLNDETLRRLLREHWPAEVRATPAFRTGVWARIEAARRGPATWGAWLRLHLAGAAFAAVASASLAAGGGAWIARREAVEARERAVASYVAAVDPHARVGFALMAEPGGFRP